MSVQHTNIKGRPINRVCPQCGLNLMPQCTTCPQCGASVPAGNAAASVNAKPAAQPADRPVFCPKCGTKNAASSRFCAACGTKLIHPEGRA